MQHCSYKDILVKVGMGIYTLRDQAREQNTNHKNCIITEQVFQYNLTKQQYHFKWLTVL